MSEWSAMLRAAVAMGLTPDAFWRLSWREWRMLTGEAAPRLARSEFEALMARFPDGGT